MNRLTVGGTDRTITKKTENRKVVKQLKLIILTGTFQNIYISLLLIEAQGSNKTFKASFMGRSKCQSMCIFSEFFIMFK